MLSIPVERTISTGRDWTAVNVLVELTRGNVNAVYTSRTRGLPAVNALVKLTTGNVNAIHT